MFSKLNGVLSGILFSKLFGKRNGLLYSQLFGKLSGVLHSELFDILYEKKGTPGHPVLRKYASTVGAH